jgi:hypothetical protein
MTAALASRGRLKRQEKAKMKQFVRSSMAVVAGLLFAAPALAQPTPWFATDAFKARHGDWSARFVEAHAKLTAAKAEHKKVADAIKAEKDKGKKAELQKTALAPRKAMWEAEQAWLKLHQEWKKFEVERDTKNWDERVAKIKAAMEKPPVAKELQAARVDLWKAELAWIEANRRWRQVESEFNQKRWQERLDKIAEALSKAK